MIPLQTVNLVRPKDVNEALSQLDRLVLDWLIAEAPDTSWTVPKVCREIGIPEDLSFVIWHRLRTLGLIGQTHMGMPWVDNFVAPTDEGHEVSAYYNQSTVR